MSKHSPITYRRHRTRSRSRDRFVRRKSPGRNRLPIHARLNDKRSIEKRLNYPSKYELFNNERDRTSFRKSKSPVFSSSRLSRRRSRSRSRNRRSQRHSSSRSPRRSRLYSRSTSRSRERSKFTYSSDYLSELIDKQNDELIRNLNYQNDHHHHLNSINVASTSNYLSDNPIIDKIPLLDRQPPIERTLYENDYYIDNNQLNDNQLNDNQFKLNLYSNQFIPIRDRLDKKFDVYPSTSSTLLETPNLNINNLSNQLNTPTISNHNSIPNNSINNLTNNNNQIINNLNNNNNQIINNQDNNGHYFRNQDIDFRNGSNNQQSSNNLINQDIVEKCSFAHLGCPIDLNKETMDSHLDECLYNPKNVKTFCNKCKLIVCPEHDCISELRNELNSTKIKTSWSQNTIKLTNSALLCDLNSEQQIISVHYSGEKEIMKKIKINKNDRIDFILKQAVDLIFTKESLFRQNKTERDFQLICTGLYAFQPETSFGKSLKLQLPTLDDHLHLILIEKRITLKVFVKRLFYENQHIIVSVPKSIPFTIDPTKRISDLKQIIGEKLPVIWSKHRLIINGKEYQDYQLLFSIGLINGDKLEVEADF